MSMPFPHLRPFSRDDVWAQTASEASDFDARAADEEGIPQSVLMENAGRSVACVLDRLFPRADVVGLVGAGNNGGDALVAIRTLQSWGYRTRVILVADRDPTDPLLHGWPLDIVSDSDLDDEGWARELAAADVAIDGLLGTGVKGPPRVRQANVIVRINESGLPVVALDVPSGIDASSGAVPGAAVRAAVTVSFGAPKVGSLLHPARPHVGRHITVEIGFPPTTGFDATATLITPTWARSRRPVRGTDTHKSRVGRLLIVGGQAGMAGAVILAARAAFHAGVGLVRVCSVAQNRELIQTALPEAIYVDGADRGAVDAAVANSDSIVAGPGLGTELDARTLLCHVVESGSAPLLLDADALNLAAEGIIDIGALGLVRPVLITPHPGEMTRLLDGDDRTLGRIATTVGAVDRFGCAVLLKGTPSLVAAPGHPLAIDTQGSSDLAVAGMGDALSGVCGALLAQGVEPLTAGALGLYLTGRAATLAGRGAGLTPSDVVRWLSDALIEEGISHTDLDLPFVTFDADPAK